MVMQKIKYGNLARTPTDILKWLMIIATVNLNLKLNQNKPLHGKWLLQGYGKLKFIYLSRFTFSQHHNKD